MGNYNSGRKPDPIAVHRLRGSYREDRHGERSDTAWLPPSAPGCPDWLGPMAKKEWERVVPLLLELDLILDTDLGVLVGYVQAFADVQAAVEAINARGYTYEAGARSYATPEVALLRDASARLHTFAGHLGLSPTARNRVQIAPSDDVIARRKLA